MDTQPPAFRRFCRLLGAFVCGAGLLVAALPLVSAPAEVATPPEGSGFSAERLQRLDKVVATYVAEGKIAGATVLLKRDGRDAYLRCFGMQDREQGRPMRTDTIFRIASMSKAVTTVAALTLYERGAFLLKDPVSKYIPAFKNRMVAVAPPPGSPAEVKYVLVPAKREMTIHDLMCHTAGLNYGDGPAAELFAQAKLQGWFFADRDETIGELMLRLATLPLGGQPGEVFMYGYATDLLGYLVEVVSGKPLDQYIAENVTGPLKMTDTHFFLPPEKASRLMPVYGLEEGKLKLIDPEKEAAYVKGPRKCFGGGAGLVSTVEDYGRFLQMLLDFGTLDGVRVLSPKTVEHMSANQTGSLYSWGDSGFGLGFWINEDAGKHKELSSFGAYGWGSAYYPKYFVDPGERLVGLILTQLKPSGGCDLADKFMVLSYQAIDE